MTIMGGRGELVFIYFHCHLVHATHSRPEYSEILFHARWQSKDCLQNQQTEKSTSKLVSTENYKLIIKAKK